MPKTCSKKSCGPIMHHTRASIPTKSSMFLGVGVHNRRGRRAIATELSKAKWKDGQRLRGG
jgi:hypothetical protein